MWNTVPNGTTKNETHAKIRVWVACPHSNLPFTRRYPPAAGDICRTAENHPINWAEGRALHAANKYCWVAPIRGSRTQAKRDRST